MEINFPKIEEKILKYWRKNHVFEKSIEKRERAEGFVFYEGPPFANGLPGIHHLLARSIKDVILRYKTMRGFYIERKAGWDTHGLPTEMEAEKKLGIKNKKEIEGKIGIKKFIETCRNSVFTYKKEWEEFTERIAFWLDLKRAYITCSDDYVESLWWILKKIWEKGLLYQDFKVVPYCPRCGTSLSSHEVAQGYKKVREKAIYVKFKILNPEFKNASFLVWTTTPWTLPGNVAIAVNPKFIYVKAKVNNDYLVLAKERLSILGKDFEIGDETNVSSSPTELSPRESEGKKEARLFAFANARVVKEFRGKELVGLRYEGFYLSDGEIRKQGFRVIPADFVSLKEGTGLVHIAPAFGEEDMEIIKAQNSKLKAQNETEFPILLTVDEEGKFRLDVKKWAGLFVKDADPLIIEDLKQRNVLFKDEIYEHDYPFCWRCNSPLLYYAKQSWFIEMRKVKKELIENNQKINWIPAHLKEGRFGEWLKEIKDWALSRERYWGTPLPIWQCKTCRNLEVIGSLEELLSQKFATNNYFFFRHGHSLRQMKNLASCWPEKFRCPLTKEGEEEVLKEAKKLKKENIDLIFSSDILRTKQTAEIISKETGAKIIFDKRLRETNVGIFNGKDPKLVWDYMSKQKNIFSAKIPKGESFTAVRKRMYNFLEKINGKYEGKNILIVSHEFPLTILEKTLEGWSIGQILEWRRNNRAQIIRTGSWRRMNFKKLPFNEKIELDFHRPYIDEVKFFCSKCKGIMERAPEVIDCWFDSGAMPFGQAHWPFAWPQNQKSKTEFPFMETRGKKRTKFSSPIKNKKYVPPELFPADFISEGIDQTRGWFYTLLAISTLLGFGPAYKNVISLGHVLDEKGEKMSKSKGNVVDPWYIIGKYGVDSARWYFYTVNQPGDSKLFSERDIQGTLRKFVLTLWNCYAFFGTYNFKSQIPNPKSQTNPKSKIPNSKHILDRWIISKLNGLIQQVTESLDKYDITFAARAIEDFAINDLSLWYIRRSRKRFHPSPLFEEKGLAKRITRKVVGGRKTGKDFESASRTLGFVLLTLSKLTAPFIPFLSEYIYQKIHNSKFIIHNSIHLEDWPEANKKLIDNQLEEKMLKVREVVALALAERAKAGIKVRQPLASLKLKTQNAKLKNTKGLLELIKDEVNVKEIVFDKKIKNEIELDTKITPGLKEEGLLREIIRNIQEMRKKAGLKPKDKILVGYSSTPELNQILARNKDFILREAKVKDLLVGEKLKQEFLIGKEIKVDREKLLLAIKKI